MTGIDVEYEQPFGIHPVQDAAALEEPPSRQLVRAREAAKAASARMDERFQALRAVTAKPVRARRRAA